MSIDLSGFGGDGLIGYRAKRHTGLIDVDKSASCEVADYWEPVVSGGRGELVLDPGEFYILASKEEVLVPADIAAAANPKSSTGRIDVFTRVITDRARAFDTVEAGYHGPLFAEISPRTFPILARSGSRLSQIRFRRGNARLDDAAHAALHARQKLVSLENPCFTGGVSISIDLSGFGGDGLIGYRAKRHTGLIDVDKS
ncbi:MAG: 2'-deoxycytidine 5'-triphosphate deaminase domain-containing protein, partial [Rhodoblastus sp.]